VPDARQSPLPLYSDVPGARVERSRRQADQKDVQDDARGARLATGCSGRAAPSDDEGALPAHPPQRDGGVARRGRGRD